MTRLRVAVHVHSSWSYDAEWSLEDIASAFRKLRYDAVLMAEHDRGFDQRKWTEYRRACADATARTQILLVPGIEYEDAENVVHVPVWGEDLPFLGSGRPTLEVLKAAREHDAVSMFAHPWRRDAISLYRPEWAELLTAVEIWNRKYDGVAPRREAAALAEREALAPFVGLDFHTRRQFFPLAMSVPLDVAPSPASLIAAIRAGACRPELLQFSAMNFNRGVGGATVRGMEQARLALRGPVRKLQRR